MAEAQHHRIISSGEFASALATAGIIEMENLEQASRIVIDADASRGIVIMYVEYLADERMLKVLRTIEGIEVKHA